MDHAAELRCDTEQLSSENTAKDSVSPDKRFREVFNSFYPSEAARENGDFGSQPGPSGLRKRLSTLFTEFTEPWNAQQLTLIENNKIDYLTMEERKVFYTACQVVPTVDPMYVYDLITVKSMSSVETVVELVPCPGNSLEIPKSQSVCQHIADLFGNLYPTIKQRVRREYMEQRRKAYLGEDGKPFDFVRFLAVYPDPKVFFEKRRKTDEVYMKHSMAFLSRKFEQYDLKFLRKVFEHYNRLLLPSYRILKKHAEAFAEGRNASHYITKAGIKVKFRKIADQGKVLEYPDSFDDVFFREAQYCLHEEEILNYKACHAANRKKELEYAKRNGLLKGMNWISCMNSACTDGRFEISSLQNILPSSLFQLLVRRCITEKIRSFNVENIELCPFCDFPTVIDRNDDQIFCCLNPICQKESCRKCQKESHIPLRCEEVEREVDFETKKRKFIEESMSEAVIRKCPRCRNSKKGHCKQDTPLEELHQMVAKRAGLEALRMFNEQNPKSIGLKVADINELAGLKKKTKRTTTTAT
uniref:RING-type domain-containing protein n=1 Tax=Setaria digitata TaxID=48799 RepID=A0A915PIJ3_9BILA